MDRAPAIDYTDKPNVLDSLNPHKFTFQIPVPSIGKRRNSTNMGLTDMIHKSIAKNSTTVPKNKYRSTVASEDPPTGLRLSQRYSSLPHTSNTNHNNTSFLNTTGRNSISGLGSQLSVSSRDPRPLRDRNFQNAIQEEIFEYLSKNKFDVETNHPISIKFLKQPTQKSFVFIFKWLYLRLDPGYVFTKSIEHEVYQVLKTLQYPYLETINKSQISAVGGSSWPKFLGMLYWLVRTNIKLDLCLNELDQNLLGQNTQELTILNHPLKTLDEQDQKQEKYELMVEKLFIEYVMESYSSFLRLEDNYEQYMEQLEVGFTKFIHIIEADIQNLGIQNDKIYMKCQDVAKRNKKLGVASEKCKALKSDLTKFQNYVNTMEHKSHEWPRKLEKMKSESIAKTQQKETLETKVRDLQTYLTTKGVSIELIDEKSNERERVTKELDAVSDKLDQLVGIIKLDKFESDGIVRSMMDAARHYNTSIEHLISARAKLGDIIDESLFKICLPDKLLQGETDAVTYEKLFAHNYSIKETVSEELSKLYSHMQNCVHAAQKDNSLLEIELVHLKEQINEKTEIIEKLEAELSETKSKYEQSKQENESSSLSQNIEIEKMEKKIYDANKLTQEKISDAQQLVQSKKLKHDELLLDINRQRVSLHKQIIEIIEYASNFKINIQSALETTESYVTKQLGSIGME